MSHFPFPYLADAADYLTTLDSLENADFPYAVLTHGGRVDDLKNLAKKNREASEAVMKYILEITKEPQSREEIAYILIRELSLPLSTTSTTSYILQPLLFFHI